MQTVKLQVIKSLLSPVASGIGLAIVDELLAKARMYRWSIFTVAMVIIKPKVISSGDRYSSQRDKSYGSRNYPAF